MQYRAAYAHFLQFRTMWSDSAFLHRTLPAIWQKRGLAAWLLRPLSALYGAGWQWQRERAMGRSRDRLPIPVLVVGNVIAGGAGKTPATIAIVQHFQSIGVPVGVISRGYGRQPDAPHCVVITPDTDAAIGGDEPVLIHLRTHAPVVVCAERMYAAREMIKLYPDVRLIVCDDGLQHHALLRDGEICVMDERGIGNGWLLPAGPLREPWPRRVDMVLQTGQPQEAIPMPPGQAVYQARRSLHDHAVRADGRQLALQQWIDSKQPVIATAGIAQPERFFQMLTDLGLNVVERHALADHVNHDALAALAREWGPRRLPVLCTEKDAVKLWDCLPQAWAIPLVLEPERSFFAALSAWWLQRSGNLPATRRQPAHTATPAQAAPLP